MSSCSRVVSTVAVVPPPLPLILTALVVAPATGVAPREAPERFAAGFTRARRLRPVAHPLVHSGGRPLGTRTSGAGPVAALPAPIAAAGMVCPDTGYAALSPAGVRHRARLAFGAFAGFKPLVPAGPLIVAGGSTVQAAVGTVVPMLISGVI